MQVITITLQRALRFKGGGGLTEIYDVHDCRLPFVPVIRLIRFAEEGQVAMHGMLDYITF